MVAHSISFSVKPYWFKNSIVRIMHTDHNISYRYIDSQAMYFVIKKCTREVEWLITQKALRYISMLIYRVKGLFILFTLHICGNIWHSIWMTIKRTLFIIITNMKMFPVCIVNSHTYLKHFICFVLCSNYKQKNIYKRGT